MRRPAVHACVIVACALLLQACAPAPRPRPHAPPPRQPVLDLGHIPPRPASVLSGSRFIQTFLDADEHTRERAILRELSRGNLPDFLRHLVRIDFRAETRSGRIRKVTLWVTPDYLAVGDDHDYVRMPMSPITAQLVADRFGFLLPTRKIVDIIYRRAAIKLKPKSFPPGPRMVHLDVFKKHDEFIDEALGGKPPRALVAGHKKDVVLSNRLEQKPHRVAIYGWHRPDSQPIQPLSTAHGDWYADYSHGVRLISATMLINDSPTRVERVLEDPELAPLISDEGPLVHTRYRTEEGMGRVKWRPRSF